MRILYVITAAEFGGAPVHVLQLIEYFRQKCHEIGLVCAPEENIIEIAKTLKIKIYKNQYFVRKVNLWQDILSLMTVIHAIRDFKPDIIHAHSTKAGYAARIAGKILGINKIVFTAHGWCFTEGTPGWRKILLLVERFLALFTSRIICVSNHDRNLALYYKIAPENKLEVIYNGIEPLSGYPLTNTCQDKFRILFVGRLAPQKDPFTLLNAITNLNFKNLEVHLVGDGELRDSVERSIHEKGLDKKIKLLGSQKREAVIQEMAITDVFVLTTNWEGLPIVILEAMALGKPVIATKVGGIPEMLNDGVNGFLVDRGNSKAVAFALEELNNKPELAKRMGERSLEIVNKKFNIDLMLSNTEKMYNSL